MPFVVSRVVDNGTVAVLLSPDMLKVTVPVCLLPPGSKLGSTVSLGITLDADSHREKRQQITALQQSLIEASTSVAVPARRAQCSPGTERVAGGG